MGVNNIQHISTLNISNKAQAGITSKLSSGFKVNRDDVAATLSIHSNNYNSIATIEENTASALSNPSDIDKADELVTKASKNILAQPEQSVLAQANQESGGVINLVN